LASLGGTEVASLRDAYRETLRDVPPRALEDRGKEPEDPAVAARLSEQRDAIWDALHAAAAGAKTELESAQLREAAAARRVNDLAPRVSEARAHLEKLKGLEAHLQSLQQLHASLQNRHARVNQFVQQQSLPVTEARVVTEATPPLRKSSPKALLILLLAASAGCTAGVGGAFAAEYFDRKVRRREQIEDELGLRCLGAVGPLVNAGQGAQGEAPWHLASRVGHWLGGPAGEVLRGVKLAVDQSTRPAGARTIALVSPHRGEGKTTIALALAILLARTGKRSLLIDGDLREASLTRALAPSATGGLTMAIEQRSFSPDTSLRHELGFNFIGQADEFAEHPADILASQGAQTAVENLRGFYDYIVFDTPSLLQHVDVSAAAGLFDAFVMVAEWGQTDLEDISKSIAQTVAGERLVGVLINKAPASDV
jgi:Mrp family chromosome partitioning ATPase